MAGMRDFLRSIDKAELHVHLEGSVAPETLHEIAPSLTLDEIRSHYRFQDFNGFLQSYKWVNLLLTEPAHYGLILTRLLESLAAQGVVYAEVNLSIGVLLWRKLPFESYFNVVYDAFRAAPIPVRFIFDAVRQFGADSAWEVARLAVASKDRGVVGFGIGGDEARGRAVEFREVFQYVRDSGLHVVPHAGETTGPESIWDALEVGAERIGHGIRAIEDPLLIKHLRDHQIPLEVCVSSNVATGAVPSLAVHPLRRLYDAGVPIVLNTDDPAMFHTDLLNEYEIAAREFGFNELGLKGLAENSLRYAFKA